jgi:hypothetical protein
VNLTFYPAEEKHLEYVHPATLINKVKETIYAVNGGKNGHKELLEGNRNTRRF